MWEFFVNNLATIIISLLLLLVVVLIIRKMVKDRKKGRSSCGCGCKDCPSSSMYEFDNCTAALFDYDLSIAEKRAGSPAGCGR